MPFNPVNAVTNEYGDFVPFNLDLTPYDASISARDQVAQTTREEIFEPGETRTVMLVELLDEPSANLLANFCINEGHESHEECLFSRHLKKTRKGKSVRSGAVLVADFGHVEYRARGKKIFTIRK